MAGPAISEGELAAIRSAPNSDSIVFVGRFGFSKDMVVVHSSRDIFGFGRLMMPPEYRLEITLTEQHSGLTQYYDEGISQPCAIIKDGSVIFFDGLVSEIRTHITLNQSIHVIFQVKQAGPVAIGLIDDLGVIE